MTIIRTDSTVTAAVNVTLADSESLYVAGGALVASSGSTAVYAGFDYHEIMVAGDVFGAARGILLGTAANKASNIDSYVWVKSGGSVSSEITAIETLGRGVTVTNEGSVSAGYKGLFHTGNELELVNLGMLSGDGFGVEIRGSLGVIHNYGTIASQGEAIRAGPDTTIAAADAGISIYNYGTITGPVAYQATAAQAAFVFTTTLLNYGVVSNVLFADGNDLYDGHAGTATSVAGNLGNDTLIGGSAREALKGEGGDDSLDGGAGNDYLDGGAGLDTLDGGAGNDVLHPGAGYDFIDGGEGSRDILDYAGSASVNVSLDLGRGAWGDAVADHFENIEGLAGGESADALGGDAGANPLYGRGGNDGLWGYAGNDTLYGGAGLDELRGGVGKDLLIGGAGADKFRFDSVQDSGTEATRDRVTDFSQMDGDTLYLASIDADKTVAGDQAFQFLGTGSFPFTAPGQLRAFQSSGETLLWGNTDQDVNTAEFYLVLSGTISLTAADFWL